MALMEASRRPFVATCRLQLNADFTLHDARARVPYLRALGISHLYLSPILAARAGSTHGYDVTDPTHVSAALGGNDAFVALAEEAHAHGMGIVLDIVPNHMGIGADNPYWDDVLAHGSASRFAGWFDVTWRAPTRTLAGKVLVPVLGDSLERVLARDEISLVVDERGVRVKYFDHDFPLDPATLPPELELAARDPAARPSVTAWTEGADGRKRVSRLLARQHYVLASWRTAQRDVNYRRFFDVNDLISLRVERQDVFEATHRTVLRFVAEGLIDGLRVDHVDGLLEPRRYLARLRSAVDARSGSRGQIPIFVEKILATAESLPESWQVDGTTGYEFMTSMEDVLIDPAGHARIEERYRTSRDMDFHSVALISKRRALRGGLNADVRRVAPMLASLARRAGWPHRSIAAYAGAIVEMVAQLPVYRTYVDAESPEPDPRDRAILEDTIARVRAQSGLDPEAVNAIELSLLGAWQHADPGLASERLAFVLRWQQLSGPAAAKGIEDTALYAYAPLTSRCEVGGDPGAPLDGAADRLFERLDQRARRYPLSLNATNTHDTKRSADARARIDALSEHADQWQRVLAQWRRRHRPLQTLVKGRQVPGRNADDFIYQALIAIWPLTAARRSTDGWLADIRQRLTAYAQKAMREAKVSTSWTDPDAAYEQAVAQFVERLLEPERNREFFRELDEFVATIAPAAMWNTLSRLVIHLTAPGVPDLYQGDELWFSALVDPDNRRPVDWAARDAALARARRVSDGADRQAALASMRDAMNASDLKMFTLRELLGLRRRAAELMEQGSFTPLQVCGSAAGRVIAFARNRLQEGLIVAVARTTTGLGRSAVGAAWGDTHILLNAHDARDWHCVIHDRPHRFVKGRILLADLFSTVPAAVLVSSGNSEGRVG